MLKTKQTERRNKKKNTASDTEMLQRIVDVVKIFNYLNERTTTREKNRTSSRLCISILCAPIEDEHEHLVRHEF